MRSAPFRSICTALFVLSIFLWAPSVSANSGVLPPASFHQLPRDQHLMLSLFHCIAEDQFGFIWFGSYHGGGLYRYDGYDLRVFVVDPSDLSNSLTSNRINTVTCTDDGYVWVGTHGGFNSLNLVTGQMRVYANDIAKMPIEFDILLARITTSTPKDASW